MRVTDIHVGFVALILEAAMLAIRAIMARRTILSRGIPLVQPKFKRAPVLLTLGSTWVVGAPFTCRPGLSLGSPIRG